MLQNQLKALKAKEDALLAITGDIKTQIDSHDLAKKKSAIKNQFQQLNAILASIQDNSHTLQVELQDLDSKRNELFKIRQQVSHIQQFKASILQAQSHIQNKSYEEAIASFESNTLPSFELVDMATPTVKAPCQLLFEEVQQQLVTYLQTITPASIPDMISLLSKYIKIFKLSYGTNIFMKHLSRHFQATPMQDEARCMIKWMDTIYQLFHKLHDTFSFHPQHVAIYDSLFKACDSFLSDHLKAYLAQRPFASLVQTLKSLHLERNENQLLLLHHQLELKDVSRYCNETSSLIDRYHTLSMVNKQYQLQYKMAHEEEMQTLFGYYKVMEVVYVQACISKFFTEIQDIKEVVEESVYLLKMCYKRSVLMGTHLEEMHMALSTVVKRLLIDNLIECYHSQPKAVLVQVDELEQYQEALNTCVEQHMNTKRHGPMSPIQVSLALSPDQAERLLRDYFETTYSVHILPLCKKLMRSIPVENGQAKYMVPSSMTTTQMELKLLGNHPVLQSILVDTLGDLAFKHFVFVKLLEMAVKLIVSQFYEALLSSQVNQRGAVLFDKDVRSLQRAFDDFMHVKAKGLYYAHHGKIREAFSTLVECSTLLNAGDGDELKQLLEDPSYQWRLSPKQMKKVILLRKDIKYDF